MANFTKRNYWSLWLCPIWIKIDWGKTQQTHLFTWTYIFFCRTRRLQIRHQKFTPQRQNSWWHKWLQPTSISSMTCMQNWELPGILISVIYLWCQRHFGDVKIKHVKRTHSVLWVYETSVSDGVHKSHLINWYKVNGTFSHKTVSVTVEKSHGDCMLSYPHPPPTHPPRPHSLPVKVSTLVMTLLHWRVPGCCCVVVNAVRQNSSSSLPGCIFSLKLKPIMPKISFVSWTGWSRPLSLPVKVSTLVMTFFALSSPRLFALSSPRQCKLVKVVLHTLWSKAPVTHCPLTDLVSSSCPQSVCNLTEQLVLLCSTCVAMDSPAISTSTEIVEKSYISCTNAIFVEYYIYNTSL